MKHTKGPWILGHNLLRPDLRLSVHEQEAGWCIANCDMRARTTAENEANARLIAAAPDLLAAVGELLSAGSCDICYEDPCDPTWCECKCHKRELDAREKAHAILARARGEES